jgi:hypothetical protein
MDAIPFVRNVQDPSHSNDGFVVALAPGDLQADQ